MRIRIVFLLKNRGGFVPFHHQYLLAQLIKGLLLKGGKKEYVDFQDYNFSGLKGQTKISRNGLHFYSSRVTLVLASGQKDFLDYFLSVLFTEKQIEVGNLHLTPEMAELEAKPDFEEEMKYICISPMLIIPPSLDYRESKKFINPMDETVSDLLYDSTMARMEASNQFPAEKFKDYFKFQIVPDVNYIRKINESQKKFARIYPAFDQDVKYEVRGYTFPFTLYAHPEVQEFLFIHGIGHFTFKGFGMLDLANHDPSKRTTKYHHKNIVERKSTPAG
ncbi:CRISPR-associated endoribonuclease Cas6 [Mangrovivirga cuniculi]|uniref:CRISPR-associated protein Cas6 n=1 Tax=Mangrovivirga cuniculi TaxID=2715131 RepID=A0A4D7JJG3_9BACT|nr:CRISPR-associated endoribonuclease Cas6 [Mangrovivirga cuniculi]QCK14837.1 CRISPR-associated protein Cas6 [Mangrovivirga cuniculi]